MREGLVGPFSVVLGQSTSLFPQEHACPMGKGSSKPRNGVQWGVINILHQDAQIPLCPHQDQSLLPLWDDQDLEAPSSTAQRMLRDGNKKHKTT